MFFKIVFGVLALIVMFWIGVNYKGSGHEYGNVDLFSREGLFEAVFFVGLIWLGYIIWEKNLLKHRVRELESKLQDMVSRGANLVEHPPVEVQVMFAQGKTGEEVGGSSTEWREGEEYRKHPLTVAFYKGKAISVSDLYFGKTYAGYLALRDDAYERANNKIIQEQVPQRVESLFGSDRPFQILTDSSLKKLPELIVYAWLTSSACLKEGDGSNLILVWFQEADVDPLIELKNVMRTLDWEKNAKDFSF